jgi:hypothetical protein
MSTDFHSRIDTGNAGDSIGCIDRSGGAFAISILTIRATEKIQRAIFQLPHFFVARSQSFNSRFVIKKISGARFNFIA